MSMNDFPTTRDDILLHALQRADAEREACGCWPSTRDLMFYAISVACPDLPEEVALQLALAVDALALDASGEEALIVPGYDDPRA